MQVAIYHSSNSDRLAQNQHAADNKSPCSLVCYQHRFKSLVQFFRNHSEKAIHMTVQLINQSIAITVPVAWSPGHVLYVLLLASMWINIVILFWSC